MPKTKLQEVVFTILMVFVMVYAMICYNIALNMGGMSNIVFLNAFHELVIMGPIKRKRSSEKENCFQINGFQRIFLTDHSG